jgi:hypothetical protein
MALTASMVLLVVSVAWWRVRKSSTRSWRDWLGERIDALNEGPPAQLPTADFESVTDASSLGAFTPPDHFD